MDNPEIPGHAITEEEAAQHIREGAARYLVIELGMPIPEGSTWKDLGIYDKTKEWASQKAVELDLPEGSTLETILAKDDAVTAARYITENELPLPDGSSWLDIMAYKNVVSV